MFVLLIACGNPLRRDDGVAAEAVQEIRRIASNVDIRLVHQLAPELAAEFAGYSAIVLVDADKAAGEVRIEKLGEQRASAALSHHFHPAAVVDLARSLFDFHGDAFLCHIPAMDFRPGCGLTARGRRQSRRAVIAIGTLLETLKRAHLTQAGELSTCAR